jgi:acetyltransferase-like isoleucine patch superfamily enzyme
MIWLWMRSVFYKFFLYRNRINSSGLVYFKKHTSAVVEVEHKFNFGIKTLAFISYDWLESRLVLEKDSLLKVSSAAIGRGGRLKLGSGAKVQIGNGTYLADNCFIAIASELSIGNNCAISWDVQIFDDDGHQLGQGEPKAPIRIGNNVWIGSRAVILKGVDIGDNCVVAAGAVVTKSFPAGSLIGGVPAKMIRENINWK